MNQIWVLIAVSYLKNYVQCWLWNLTFHTNTLWTNWRLRCWVLDSTHTMHQLEVLASSLLVTDQWAVLWTIMFMYLIVQSTAHWSVTNNEDARNSNWCVLLWVECWIQHRSLQVIQIQSSERVGMIDDRWLIGGEISHPTLNIFL